MNVEETLKGLPDAPGVYLFHDQDGTIIYVGKALSLRSRVRSYFRGGKVSAKVLRLRQLGERIDYIVTGSEVEALLLEQTLIKEHRPKYNVMLKDDKRYPYIHLTGGPYPKLTVVRRRQNDGRTFGPYPGGGAVNETLRLMRRIFPLRTCTDQKLRTTDRPCLMYHIGRCPAPCVGRISAEDYGRIAADALSFLEGKHGEVLRRLREQMEEAAVDLRFEEAASLRNRIQAVTELSERQAMDLGRDVDMDVVGFSRSPHTAVVEIFLVRSGTLIGRERLTLAAEQRDGDAEIMGAALENYYTRAEEVPPDVLVRILPDDRDMLESWLSERRGAKARVRVPQRGEAARLLRLAEENAALAQKELLGAEGFAEEALLELQEVLGLSEPPARIEGYDISNTQGRESVAAMVVFDDGRPLKAHYRIFRIRTVQGANDFASLAEAITRRFAHPGGDASFTERPDLLLIDGGKGQLSAVVDALKAGSIDIPVISLAKREEEIFLPDTSESLRLAASSPARRLLQQVRDEVHRYGLGQHQRLRSKASLSSKLDDLEGIGPKRKRELLRRFGSLQGIRAARLEELYEMPGLPRKVADRLYETLHEGVNA